MSKTTWKFDGRLAIKSQRFTRCFDTLEAAQKFAKGKDVLDIYRAKGKFCVEWVKKTVYPDNMVRTVIDEKGHAKHIVIG